VCHVDHADVRVCTHTRAARVPLTARDKSPLPMLAPRISHKSGVHGAIHTYVPFKRARIKGSGRRRTKESERQRRGWESGRDEESRGVGWGRNGVPRT